MRDGKQNLKHQRHDKIENLVIGNAKYKYALAQNSLGNYKRPSLRIIQIMKGKEIQLKGTENVFQENNRRKSP